MSRPELLSGERKQRLAAGICNVTAKYLGRVALVQSERVKNYQIAETVLERENIRLFLHHEHTL